MTVDTSEVDLDTTKEEVADLHPLHILQQSIANMPAVDAEKVQAVINKLAQGNFEILGDENERLKCAERIVEKIIAESIDPKSSQ